MVTTSPAGTGQDAARIEDIARATQHEAGHAVAACVLGVPHGRVTLSGVQPPPGGTRTLVGTRMLIAACGAIADYQRRGLVLPAEQVLILLLGPDDRFELADPRTGRREQVPRGPAVAPGADLAVWVYYATTAMNLSASSRGPGDQEAAAHRDRAELARFLVAGWRDCERLTTSARPAIDAVAAALAVRGELDAAEVSALAGAALAGYPVPLVPDWARP